MTTKARGLPLVCLSLHIHKTEIIRYFAIFTLESLYKVSIYEQLYFTDHTSKVQIQLSSLIKLTFLSKFWSPASFGLHSHDSFVAHQLKYISFYSLHCSCYCILLKQFILPQKLAPCSAFSSVSTQTSTRK